MPAVSYQVKTLYKNGLLNQNQNQIANSTSHISVAGKSQITGGKKQSDEGAALFAVRVNLHC
jgi:hypothetical protein